MNRIISCLAVVCLVLGLAAGSQSVAAQGSAPTNDQVPPAQGTGPTNNQFTQVDHVDTNWHIDQTIPDSYGLVAENATFKLYVDLNTLAFKVVDKRSGYVWHSTLDQKAADDRLNKSWEAFAKSSVSINYLDQQAVSRRISLTDSKHTLKVKPVDQGVQGLVTFSDVGITVGVTLRLEASGVSIEVPFDSVKESDPKFKLGLLYLYPFFGATRGDSVPGYMFIPDGSGALIRFSSTTKAKNMLYDRIYGQDLGMIGSVPWDPFIVPPYQASIPVTGMVHGYKQNAFLSVVEKGAAYGEIQVHPAGVITNFNFLTTAFVYNESYFQPTNRAGDGVTTLQHETNHFDVKVHYRFLTKDDSDYVGMARSYQQYLVEKGMLKKTTEASGDIGIRLEFLGAEKQKILLWYSSIPVTTIDQMSQILADLGPAMTDVTYYGWQPLGASSMPPQLLKLDGSLGSVDQLRSLADKVRAGGGNFYLYLDPQAALQGQGGYSARNDLAMAITGKNLAGYSRGNDDYYLNLDALQSHTSGLSKAVFSSGQIGLALDGIGWNLYSDFKSGHFLNRVDAMQKYQELLSQNPGSMAFYAPNDYMFALMKAYYDMPLGNSGYIYTTDVVPFLQIVLAGYVPYYGKALNFSSNLRQDLLRQIDYGVYPSYFLTHEPTGTFLNTPSKWIYSSSYDQWGQEIKDTYRWMNSLLAPIKGQAIIAREVLQEGVVATTYANGKRIVVNYNGQSYSAGGLTVNAQDAVITEAVP